MKRFLLAVLFSVLMILPSAIDAQEAPALVTDRPDRTESALVVPAGFYQFEIGFEYEVEKGKHFFADTEIINLTLGSTLFRYGLNDLFELRLGGEYLLSSLDDGKSKSRITGVKDLLAGTKLQIRSNEEIITNLALIFQAYLPFGNEKLRPEKICPELIVTASQEFGLGISMGVNIGLTENYELGSRSGLFSSTINKLITERLGFFVEINGEANKMELPQLYFNSGITYLQKKNLQLDFLAGKAINRHTDVWYGGMGISIRVPE